MNITMSMKVAHIITSLNSGGAEMTLYRLLRLHSTMGMETAVCSLASAGKCADLIARSGIEVHTLDMKPGAPNPFKVLELLRWLRRQQPDVVKTWMYHSDLLGGIAARAAGNIPVVWGIRHSKLDAATDSPSTAKVAKVCAMLSGLVPARIVCCSEAALVAHAEMGYDEKKMTAIPNGVDARTFSPDPAARAAVRSELGLSESIALTGMIARYHKVKNHRGFLEAAATVSRKHPTSRFVLCGEGITWDNDELVSLISALGIKENCLLLGDRNDVHRLMTALDVLVSASYSEGFPNVVAEAMASCVPCVVTNVGESAVIVGETGLVVPPGDVAALTSALLALLEAPMAYRSCLGNAARDRIVANYSANAMAERFAAVFAEIAGKRRTRPGTGPTPATGGWRS